MTRALLLIDDRQIRMDAFAEAEKLIKKLDRLEADLDSFREQDQRLFGDWVELSFREERAAIEKLRAEYARLGRMHNWMIALEMAEGLSAPEALIRLQREEALYAQGSAEERRVIEEERRKRDEIIDAEMAREESPGVSRDEEAEPDDDPEASPEHSEQDLIEFKTITALSNGEIIKTCQSEAGAFELLSKAIGLARSMAAYGLFMRVWDLTPQKHQKTFVKFYRSETGVHLTDRLISAMRGAVAPMRDEEPEEGSYDGEFVGSRTRKSAAPDAVEAIKSLYRKLVRLLHPDLQGDHQYWQKEAWTILQRAYKAFDLEELRRLERVVMIRGRHLTELSVSEIRESQLSLQLDLERLNREVKNFKRSPAWRFSSRKDFQSLRSKVEKQFAAEFDHIYERVAALRAQHAWLERAFYSGNSARRERKQKKARRRNSRSY